MVSSGMTRRPWIAWCQTYAMTFTLTKSQSKWTFWSDMLDSDGDLCIIVKNNNWRVKSIRGAIFFPTSTDSETRCQEALKLLRWLILDKHLTTTLYDLFFVFGCFFLVTCLQMYRNVNVSLERCQEHKRMNLSAISLLQIKTFCR